MMEKTHLLLFLFVSVMITACFFGFVVYSICKLSDFDANELTDNSSSECFGLNDMNTETSRGLESLFVIKSQEDDVVNLSHPTEGVSISEFRNRDYLCKGFCWCDIPTSQFSQRRVISSTKKILKKSIFTTIASVCTYLALRSAKESFQESCGEKLYESCDSSDLIRSEVDSCEAVGDDEHSKSRPRLKSSSLDLNSLVDVEQEIVNTDVSMPDSETFICSGRCQPSKSFFKSKRGREMSEEVHKCENMKMDQEELVLSKDFVREWRGSVSWVRKIRKEFSERVLHDFCTKNSQVTDHSDTDGTKEDVSMCVSGDVNHIKCKKKYPDVRIYFCRGNCVTKNLKNPKAIEMAEEFGCENLRREGQVVIDNRDFRHLKRTRGEFEKTNDIASRKFRKEHLTGFCRENSQGKYWWNRPKGKKGQWQAITMCVSKAGHKWNNSIHCMQTYPITRNKGNQNPKYW